MSLPPQTPDQDSTPEPPAAPTPETPAQPTEPATVVEYPYQPGAGWAYAPAPTPAPPQSTGRLLATVLGVVAGAAVLAVTAGLLVGSRVGAGVAERDRADSLAVPEVGMCWDALVGQDAVFNGGAETEEEVSCDQRHLLETIAAGAIDASESGDWLNDRDELSQELFADCEKDAERILGAHWRATYTRLVLSAPGFQAWRDGARWYRCDLGTTDGIWGPLVPTKGSIRDTAEQITCVEWELSDDRQYIADIEPAECDERHDGEFAGAFRASLDRDARRVTDDDIDGFSSGCWPIVLDFLDRDDLSDELTFWFYHPIRGDELDESVVCIVASSEGKKFDGSLAGVGSGPLPLA
jgi:hypothetical protein